MPTLRVTFDVYEEDIHPEQAAELLLVKLNRPDDMWDYLDNFVSGMDNHYRVDLVREDGTVTELENY